MKSAFAIATMTATVFFAPKAAVAGDCSIGAVSWPVGNPWLGSYSCEGKTCIAGICTEVVVSPGPGIYKIFCSCDGENPSDCCHIESTADSSTGQITHAALGDCGINACPGDLVDTCTKHPVEVLLDGVVIREGFVPLCTEES